MTHLNFVHLIMTYNYKSFFMLSGIWKLETPNQLCLFSKNLKFFSGILQRCSLEIEFARAKNQMKCFMLNYTFQRENSHLIYAQLTWPVIMTFFPFRLHDFKLTFNACCILHYSKYTWRHTQPRILISSVWQNLNVMIPN